MSEARIFPYGITLREGGIIETVPIAEISFLTKDKERLALFLVIDSGASVSAFPKSDAVMFGIVPEAGAYMTISGIAGEPIAAWKHSLAVKLNNIAIRLPIVFLDAPNAPRVLGREGIFDIFTIVFEENKRRTALLKNKSLEAQTVAGIIKKLAK